jgi:hypothetical protein
LKTNVDALNDLETIDHGRYRRGEPKPIEVEIELDREIVRDRAETVWSTSDIIVYSDASGHQGYLGAAVVALDDNLEIAES